MFGFGPGSSSITTGRHDSTKDRAPPPRPTPVALPKPVGSLDPPVSWTAGQTPDLPDLFARLKRPQDVNSEHIAAFNVNIHFSHSLEDFLSDSPTLSKLPPEEWLQPPDPNTPEPLKATLSNGRPVPTRRDFLTRAKELQFENQHAFSALSRLPLPDTTPPRLVHFRRFWDGLDNMAYYWDTSLDQYITLSDEHVITPPPPLAIPDDPKASSSTHGLSPESSISGTHLHEPRKKAKTGDSPSTSSPEPDALGPVHVAFKNFQNATELPTRTQSHRDAPMNLSPTATSPTRAQSNSLAADSDVSTGTYKGNRIGNGVGMPDPYRMDTVRSFIEAVSWAFGVTIAPHRRQPMLALQNLRFPVRVSSAVWRAPTDRLKARSGWLEGPVIGLQVRPELAFPGMQEKVLDALRELAGLLYIAQERHREGKEEKKPGEGKWWASKPRWGGGPGGEIGEGRGEDDTLPAPITNDVEVKERKEKERGTGFGAPSRLAPSGPSSRSSKKRANPVEAWKEVKPGMGTWDPRIKYEAVGREDGDEWDEVFMVSTIVHHMSILKLRVHRAYLDFLNTGTVPSPLPADPTWCQPSLKRTQWYDFFSREDRIKAMRALWAIIGYSLRPKEERQTKQSSQQQQTHQQNEEKADVVMTG